MGRVELRIFGFRRFRTENHLVCGVEDGCFRTTISFTPTLASISGYEVESPRVTQIHIKWDPQLFGEPHRHKMRRIGRRCREYRVKPVLLDQFACAANCERDKPRHTIYGGSLQPIDP